MRSASTGSAASGSVVAGPPAPASARPVRAGRRRPDLGAPPLAVGDDDDTCARRQRALHRRFEAPATAWRPARRSAPGLRSRRPGGRPAGRPARRTGRPARGKASRPLPAPSPAGPARRAGRTRSGARGDGGTVARGRSRTDRASCQLRVWAAGEVAQVGGGGGAGGPVVADLEARFEQTAGGLARQRTARVNAGGRPRTSPRRRRSRDAPRRRSAPARTSVDRRSGSVGARLWYASSARPRSPARRATSPSRTTSDAPSRAHPAVHPSAAQLVDGRGERLVVLRARRQRSPVAVRTGRLPGGHGQAERLRRAAARRRRSTPTRGGFATGSSGGSEGDAVVSRAATAAGAAPRRCAGPGRRRDRATPLPPR